MNPGPGEHVVQSAKGMKVKGKSLTDEAESLWNEVQSLMASSADPAQVEEKVARLKQIRAQMSTTASDFVSLMKQNPHVVSHLDDGSMQSSQSQRRKSRFSTASFEDCGDVYQALGGRSVSLKVASSLLGELECIMLEPRGKQLAPKEYVTTGLVICFQGMPPSKLSLKEWCEASESANWLKLGATVVLPNIQAASALAPADLGAVVDAVCDYVGFSKALLVGKDLMANRIIDLVGNAADILEDNHEVSGVVLVGPSSPVPQSLGDVEAPVLLLWAQDDDISPFSESVAWVEAFDDADDVVATVKECQIGGHSLDVMLADPGAATTMQNFFVSTFLISDLLQADAAEQSDGEQDMEAAKSQARIENLTSELPSAVREACKHPLHTGDDGSMKRRMTANIANWIASGMSSTSE